MAASQADEAVIVSGDIDPAEFKKKMDIFSMMVPQHFVENSHGPDYVWEPSVMPSVVWRRTPSGDRGIVRVAYASPRTSHELMNTAQALVMGILSREFRTIAMRRIERNLRDAGIPYGKLDFQYLNSTETGGDEEYAVEVLTDREHLEAAMKTVSQTLAGLDEFGVPVKEFTEAKQAMMAGMLLRGSASLTNRQYVDRCTAHFLYGANLAPFSEETRLFARKNVADSTETRLFNQFSTSLLSQLSNLTLEYRAKLDSLDEDNALFQYNLAYLYGSTFQDARDYSWQRDTSSLEVACPKVKIKETKPEPVSGGVLWTFSNGVRVVYKQVPGSGMFNYALLLGGGLSGVSGLEEGEGGYFGDMLSLYDAGGLSASDFRDHLAVNGIDMHTQVALTFTSISGSAPSSKLPSLLKVFLALANRRTLNRGEFDIYLRNAAWARESVEDRLYKMMYPGFSYTPRKYPSALGPATQVKAAQFYDTRFSRMNNGMLVIVGDVDEAAASGRDGAELGYVDIAVLADLGQAEEADVQKARMIEVELRRLVIDAVVVDLGAERLALGGFLTQAGRVYRNRPDVAQPAGFPFHLGTHGLQDVFALGGILGEEDQAGAVSSLFRNGNSLQENEFMGNLDHDSGAVARFSIRPFCPTVAHVFEHRQGVVDQLVRLVAPDIHDHTNPTGIVFRCRIVQSVFHKLN